LVGVTEDEVRLLGGLQINPTNRCRAREQRLASPRGFAAGEEP
jgi:hypothetical protein